MALAFALGKFPVTFGFDVDEEKIEELKQGYDRNQQHFL